MKLPHLISAIALTANFAAAQDVADSVAAPVTVDSATVPAAVATVDSAATSVAQDSAAVATADSAAVADSATVSADSAAVDSAAVAVADSAAKDSTVANITDSTKTSVDSSVVAAKADTVEVIPLLTGTEISGKLHGFLKAAQSPYVVTGDIQIEKNTALIVEPGVILQFAPGTGLYVQGQFVVAGSSAEQVLFKSASSKPKGGDWKGIFITGENTSEIRYATITGAANGIAVENSSLNLRFTKVEKTTDRGVFVKNSKIEINDCQFLDNAGAALHIASYSEANVERAKFSGNNVALYNASLAATEIGASEFKNNNVAVLDMGNSHIVLHNSAIEGNNIGTSAADVLDPSVLENTGSNKINFAADPQSVAGTLPANPEIQGIESRPVNANDKIEYLMESRAKAIASADSTPKSWSVMGNIMIGDSYHYVKTRKNHSSREIVVGNDTIASGKHYKNYFQVPGFGTEFSVYMLMQSPEGRTIEFNADVTSDSWNKYSPNPMTLTYKDHYNQLMLGDIQKNGGDIYMSSLPVFGTGYTLSLLKNNAEQPLFELGGFFGEVRKPYLLDTKHPYIYNDYIDDGEMQAQRLAYGGSFKWAPLRRFDATFGFVYANDELEDPLLRDGIAHGSTNEPLQTSLTVYADGNWLFYPGDIELKGMIAVGRADTADVVREHAINKVFSEAGLNVSSYSKLRQLMSRPSKINTLSNSELEEIFGDNTTLRPSDMKDSLRTLITAANKAKKEEDSDIDDSRVMGLNWGSQNFAIGASLNWNIYKTSLSGHIKYVGEDYYSAGSADQLSDTREFGGRLEQIITSFWTLGFGYDLNIENAANGSKTNLLGLGEGTRWGLFPDEDANWFDEHELDNDRTKYIQNFNLDNTFKIGSKVTASIGYNLEYRTQYRPYQLHGDYMLEDGIYNDGWFSARKDRAVTTIIDDDKEIEVDSARWADYNNLANEKYLASKFQERIYRNTWKAELAIEAFSSVFKIGGIWTLRTDDSKFFKDSLVEDMELENTTWEKLGYYFGGADYFEQTYPASISTDFNRVQNRFEATPRIKNYERDDMSEKEITLMDEFEISFMNRFMTVGLSGEFRFLTTSWEENGNDQDETEMDVLGGLNLKFNHSKHLSSKWYTGTAMYYRPDNLSDEYKDIYGGIRVNYVF